MKIARDATTGHHTLIEDDGAVHHLFDLSDIPAGTYPIYRYPDGHITYSPNGKDIIKTDTDRMYGRDGTVQGCVRVGDVTIA